MSSAQAAGVLDQLAAFETLADVSPLIEATAPR
jgi:hypothetical protein